MLNKFRIGITDDTKIMRCRLMVRLIEMCGCIPVLISTTLDDLTLEQHLELTNSILESCDALIFPGNKRDVHPNLYGQDYIHPETQKRLPIRKSNVRQETEIHMIKYALQNQNLPILGICGGMQIINTALGGNLIQHLPDDVKTNNSTRANYHYDENLKNLTEQDLNDFENNFDLIIKGTKKNIYSATHPMKVYSDSLLAKIYQSQDKNIDLNNIGELSIHHQGCFEENLSNSLKISAISPDGVVEAAEHKNYPKMFLLTQFHPECNVSGIALKLVEELVRSISE